MDSESNIPQSTEEKASAAPSPYLVPAAIVVAGILIAGAVLYAPRKSVPLAAVQNPADDGSAVLQNIKAVSPQDHIFGNANAPVKIVEFSDLECPFCKQFHKTMMQVMQEYGVSGRIAWVYRHFPLSQLHSQAPHEAEASECAAALGGNDVFWKYITQIFTITPSNNGLDLNELPKIAESLGLDRAQFESCLSGGKYKALVDADAQDAVASGGQGTPYSVVIAQNGKKFAIDGAQSYEAVKATIEEALQEK